MRRRAGIPSADVPELRREIRRTRWLRGGLALVLVLLLALDVRASRALQSQQGGFIPNGASVVVVLDLSLSIVKSTYPTIGSLLGDIAKHDTPAGLVIFSDAPYELVPPGSPGADLRPFIRYFTPIPGEKQYGNEVFPANPWSSTFRGGTSISSGLGLAVDALHREHMRHAVVILASDLDDSAADVTRLTGLILEMKREGLPLRIVPLFPNPKDRAFFERLLGSGAFDPNVNFAGQLKRHAQDPIGGGTPWSLIVLASLLALVLGVNERTLARLVLPRRASRAEAAA